MLTLWTIRVATAWYVLALAAWILAWPAHRIRTLWTLGCLCFLAHVAAAFTFQHGWSHEAAYRETARQTAELFHVDSGSGIYFNYFFAVVWTADVAWWWSDDKSYLRRPRWLSASIHGFMAFMFLNGAIVFASPPMRWCSLAALAGLMALRMRARGH